MIANLRLVSTCPESHTEPPAEYLETVRATARWCDEAGHHGLLIHAAHRLMDPWVLAQVILQETQALRPVVTVQPLLQHPYEVAKRIGTLAGLYGRAPDVVLAAGASKQDLLALDDSTPHDQRYQRLVEFGWLLGALLTGHAPVDFEGSYYRAFKPVALAPLAPEQAPSLFVAASSAAGRAAGLALGAVPVAPFDPRADVVPPGIRVGLISRPDTVEAETIASARFPEVSARRVEQRLGNVWSDSAWHRDLEALGDCEAGALWMAPYEHGYAQVPYLVGDYAAIARELTPALRAGARWIFLDAPAAEADVCHSREALTRAWRRAVSGLALAV